MRSSRLLVCALLIPLASCSSMRITGDVVREHSIKWRAPKEPKTLKQMWLEEENPLAEQKLLEILSTPPEGRARKVFDLGLESWRGSMTAAPDALWQHALDLGYDEPRDEGDLEGGEDLAALIRIE